MRQGLEKLSAEAQKTLLDPLIKTKSDEVSLEFSDDLLNGVRPAYNAYRNYGFPVRCIAREDEG